MQDPFPEWSAQLRRDGVGPENTNAITRGLDHGFTLELAGDFSAANFEMAARAAPDAGSSLADWAVSVGSFADGVTPVSFVLITEDQGSLPPNADGRGVDYIPYDILCSPVTGFRYRMMAGYVPISGAVTSGVSA